MTFGLQVLSSPAEPAVNIDLSKVSQSASFTVAAGGYLYCHVSDWADSFDVEIKSNEAVVLDNRKLREKQSLVITLPRPGVYALRDTAHSGIATIRVKYPTLQNWATGFALRPPPMVFSKNVVAPKELTVESAQAILVNVIDGSRIVAKLVARTDRSDDAFVDTPVEAV